MPPKSAKQRDATGYARARVSAVMQAALSRLLRTKEIGAAVPAGSLRAVLGVWDLIFLGVGGVIGAGVFVLTGIVAATQAGPALMLSFVVAGFACAFAALSYAELAACVGGCGSAYGYAYAGLGELVAWIIGWALMLEYGLAVSAVAIGWSGYFAGVMSSIGIQLPEALLASPAEGGVVNLPAMLIIFVLGTLLAVGVRSGAHFNNAMVLVKLIAILVFLAVAAPHVRPVNWQPFMPFGFAGVMQGAALIFFAYIGFDAVSTAAEEARNPQRDLPIGIIASLAVCTLLYIAVAGVLTGIVHYSTLNVASPVADALLAVGSRIGGGLVAAGAMAGLTSVMLVSYYGQTRVFLAMSRDGLLPAVFSRVHPVTGTPLTVIALTGTVAAAVAGLTPISTVAELVNIGTLSAFIVVCAGVIVLRRARPDLPRPFRAPWSPLVPLLGVVFCGWLMLSLPAITWLRFGAWMGLGLLIYFGYSVHRSALAKAAPLAAPGLR